MTDAAKTIDVSGYTEDPGSAGRGVRGVAESEDPR